MSPTSPTHGKKQWRTPQVTVIQRTRSEEHVLGHCKTALAPTGSASADMACTWDALNCNFCLINDAS
jgi:hypothetical protein